MDDFDLSLPGDFSLPPERFVALPQAGSRGAVSTPSHHAASMRDHEEVIAELKKENFGLKLRIYHMEDHIRRMAPGGAAETLQLNIDLNVELEALKLPGQHPILQLQSSYFYRSVLYKKVHMQQLITW